jgi:rhamnogalacturonan endolyase
VYGAATIASNGTLLYSTGLCHGDALHVGSFDPGRHGQQVYMVHETPACYGTKGMEMHNAATGAILWSVDGEGQDVGRGTCMDIDPAYPGEECWSTVGGVRSATGALIANVQPPRINFAVWWDGDLLRESLDIDRIDKWNPATLSFDRLLTGQALGAYAVRGSKAQPVLSADLFGDWREEIVWRTLNSDALMIFSTTIPTSTRLPTLMHNPQYRAQVAGQNAGYNQPPHPSFYLGNGMGAFVQETVHLPYSGNGVIQAETAIVGGGAVMQSARTGYRGTGYINFPVNGGSAQLWRINGGAGGAKTITSRFANGGATTLTGVLRVNGVAQAITFPVTGAWTTWSTMNQTVTLAAGMENTLSFESTGQDLALIDELTVP